MKVIMIYDQIQSGAGIKDDHMIPLGAKKEPGGPAIMMEQYLKGKLSPENEIRAEEYSNRVIMYGNEER